MESKFFPVSINLEKQNVLVLGAGKISFRKVKTLLHYGCNITVLTQEVKEDGFFLLAEEKKILLKEKHVFSEQDLENIFLVVAATSDETYNKEIVDLCRNKNILVNNITSKEEMTLRFSSIYETEDFQVAVSAKGDPKKAKEVKENIEAFLKSTSNIF